MARLKFEKEKSEIKVNDPQAATPKKKRGRPKDPHSFHRRMVDLCAEFGNSMEGESLKTAEDKNDSDHGSEEDIYKVCEDGW
jgi:hypothetical protein